MGQEVKQPVPRWVWVAIVLGCAVAVGCLAMAWILSQQEGWVGRFERRGKVVEREALLPVERAVVPVYVGPTEKLVEVMGEISVSVVVTPSVVGVTPTLPRWQVNAVTPVEVPAGVGKLAIVIDDMGVDRILSERALAVLPPEVTMAFLPYGLATRELAVKARGRGHEILVHMPMEPLVHRVSDSEVVLEMGPGGLKVGMGQDEVTRLVRQNIDGLKDLAVGANNHMGSKFTLWPEGMRTVLGVLADEGMMFLDSRTVAKTAVREAAAGLGLPVLGRDVFLDHEGSAEEVRRELYKAIELAKKRGFAVAIGHPLPVTLEVLAAELGADGAGILGSGVRLVPVTMGLNK